MAKLNFKNGRVEDYTLVLSTRDHRHLGQLTGIKSESIQNNRLLTSADEISFTLYKTDLLKIPEVYADEMRKRILMHREALWTCLEDFRLIWVKELDEYFQIKVSTDDGFETTKTVVGTSLCEAELGQLIIDSLEVNTDEDLIRTNGTRTFFYSEDQEFSLLHRTLKDKAPHYTIGHVDASLQSMTDMFVFSVSGSSIFDFLTREVAEQIHCLFQFDSKTRTINVYDLYTTCKNTYEDENGNLVTCNHRGDFYDECPICKNKDKSKMSYFGKDTTILVDKKNLTDTIHLEQNTDEVKNALKMVAGDDLMNSTIRNLNQNGSDYLDYISEFQMNDMSEELKEKLLNYQVVYESFTNECEKLIVREYDLYDHVGYLQSAMLPSPKINDEEINARSEADKLIAAFNKDGEDKPVLGMNVVSENTTNESVNSALKYYARVFVKSGYVKIDASGTFEYTGEEIGKTAYETYHYGTWTGKFTITNYSNKEDVVETDVLTVKVNDDMITYSEQKVLKTLLDDAEKYSFYDVFEIEDNAIFIEELKKYCFDRLLSFRDAYSEALTVLGDMGVSGDTILDETNNEYDPLTAALHKAFYTPYSNRQKFCQEAMDRIQGDKEFQYVMDEKQYTGCIEIYQKEIEDIKTRRAEIQSELNLETYLGADLYKKYCSYRREGTYENANYISTGLTNAEVIERAKEFIEAAKKEMKRVAEPQLSLSSTLKNLLVIKEFEPIVDNFELGNWIRVRVDGTVYTLRLIGYSLNFGNIQDINVEFSTVSKVKDIAHEVQQVIKNVQSMSTSFSYVAQQAKQGEVAKTQIDDWLQNGLNSSMVNIKNDDESFVINDKGMLFRLKDVDDSFNPKQLKIYNNQILFTKDDWKTVSQAIGEHSYKVYDEKTNTWITLYDYGVTAKFLTAGYISGSDFVGGSIRSLNFSNGKNNVEEEQVLPMGTYIDLINGTFSFAGERFKLDALGNLTLDDGTIRGGSLLIGDKKGTYAEITPEGILNCQGANFTGTVKGSTVIGGEVKSENYSNEDGKREGSYINLETGELDLGGGGLTYLDGKFQIASKTVTDTLKEIGIFDDNLKIKASNINAEDGYISLKEDVQDIPLTKISGTNNGLITSNQIENLSPDKISDTLSSSQIAKELLDKEVTGSFNGEVTADTVKVTSDGTTYTGLTGEFTINTSATLKIVNGIIVAFTENN